MSRTGFAGWADELDKDIQALEEAVRREERRGRGLRALEVSEVQRLMERESERFSRLVLMRRRLLGLLGKGNGGSGAGSGSRSGSGNYVVRHRQEGHIPDGLVTMYEALWIKTYGTEAGYIGDPNSLTSGGVGRGNQSKMAASGERVYRAGAKSGRGGGSTRSVIRDERAFNFKRKMDKRMRRLATEISDYLRSSGTGGKDVGESSIAAAGVRCGRCQCFVERDWKYCARCGTSRGAEGTWDRISRHATRE